MSDELPLPLEGVRVLDLTRLLPGAFTTSVLADLGADVLKVEQPGTGDPMRAYAPRIDGMSAYSWLVDRGKRSVVVDLRAGAGVDVVRRLAAEADMVVEGFRPGVAERLGVGFDALREANPALVYCSLSGYGASGPRVAEAGHDLNYVARAGLLSVTGRDGAPAIPGTQIADLAGALFGVAGLLAALVGAQRTGIGRHVGVGLGDAALAMMPTVVAEYAGTGEVPRFEAGMLTGAYPSYAIHRCADGRYVSVAALEPAFWRALCDGVGRPDLLGSHSDAQALPVWRALFASRTRDEWLAMLAGTDACVAPVHDIAEALADEHLRARGMALDVACADGEIRPALGSPIHFGATPRPAPAPAEALGASTREALAAVGYGDAEIGALLDGGVVEAPAAGTMVYQSTGR